MSINIKDLCEDYGIECSTEHHHVTEGWINLRHCPFCNSNNYHLGYNPTDDYFHCWRCGYHSTFSVLKRILHLPASDVGRIIKEYSTGTKIYTPKTKIEVDFNKEVKYPINVYDRPKSIHVEYLQKRNFDWEEIQFFWKIKFTGALTEPKWRRMIIIPIFVNGKLVNYQGRDVTGKRKQRYTSLSKKECILTPKQTLYGIDHIRGNKIVVVEGVTDVWRIGYGAVATFGVNVSIEQLKILLQFDNIVIAFDPDEPGKYSMNKLKAQLEFFGKKVRTVFLDKDPADMPESEARKLLNE